MKILRSILSKVLEIDGSEITDDTSPENTESWDSFNGLMLVSELEENFKVKFTMDEVLAVKCVRDIKEALRTHGIKFEEHEI